MDENSPVYQIICRTCGQTFEAKGHNARFCPECGKRRKCAQDHISWVRRRKRAEDIRLQEGGEPIAQLEKRHMTELGLPQWYYNLYKSMNKSIYYTWMKKNMEVKPKG